MKSHAVQPRSIRTVRGSVSLLVLVATIPLLVALGAMLTVSVVHHQEAEQSLGQSTAAMTSFAAAQDALSRLEISRKFDGPYDLVINGGTAHVTGFAWMGDGVDNDKNGLIDDAAEKDIYTIHTDGWLNATAAGKTNAAVRSYHASTDVTAEVVNFDFNFGQAIYIDDPKAKINFTGGAFTLTGNDENLDGSKGPDSSKPAIGINGDPSGVIGQIAKNQRANITGSLPDPAIGKVDALTFDTYSAMLDPLASVNFNGPDDSYSGNLGDFQKRKGVIAHAAGNLKMHGKTSGAGILIVDGDLVMDGAFQWAGLLIVKGNVYFKGGGSPQQLYGALLLWGKDPVGQPEDDLTVNGSVQVAYSSQGVALADTTGGVRVLFWREQ